MLIVCPSCASEYALDPERIGDGGRKVRCAVCRTTWFVGKPEPAPERSGADLGSRAPGPETGLRVIEAAAEPTRPNNAAPPGRRTRSLPLKRDRMPERLAAAAIAFVLVAAPTAIALRHELVRRLPESAPLFAAVGLGVNLVGLELADVTAGIAEDGPARALVIEGEIRSVAAASVQVPRLEFVVEGKDRTGLYRWSVKPPVPELGPGESARFTARLASPPPDGARLVASFQSTGADPSVALR
ncbi:zinc-ribbon domain-containing protein [Enterovirga aerilata]|uniref:Zinc finger/thioredoxin putative domain-containing protein n=1 Tax=Enterovirga aerilata TaxID=2730920 RepID=A0A849I1Y8_9HYPH|nr:zinc-ribbon domain-containing protein [Enterovirga sp. DB1703]NNM71358.1 hypothetical protein [Enterovirga sp. DB1703]